jgi:hypothetical protein
MSPDAPAGSVRSTLAAPGDAAPAGIDAAEAVTGEGAVGESEHEAARTASSRQARGAFRRRRMACE